MSPERWERRLGKAGLTLRFFEHSGGYDADDAELTEWTVVVEPMDSSRNDKRFRPLLGLGRHFSFDAAVQLAVKHLEAQETELRREQAVLALAKQPEYAGGNRLR